MAQKTTFEKSMQRPSGNRLYMNTFGPAWLYYKDIRICNDRELSHPVGTNDFRFNLHVPERHHFDILINNQERIVMSIDVGEAFSTQLCVEGNKLMFDSSYTAQDETMTQKFQVCAPKHMTYNFKLVILPTGLLQRVDLRLNFAAWQTAVLYGRRLLQLRPNGDFFFSMLERLINDVRKMPPSHNVDLTLEQRVLGFAARATPAAVAHLNELERQMPALVPIRTPRSTSSGAAQENTRQENVQQENTRQGETQDCQAMVPYRAVVGPIRGPEREGGEAQARVPSENAIRAVAEVLAATFGHLFQETGDKKAKEDE